MKKKVNFLLLQVFGVLTFLSIPVFTSPDFNTRLDFLYVEGFQRHFTVYVLLVIFFYLNYYWLIPKFYFRKKIWLYVMLVAAAYAIVVAVPEYMFPNFGRSFHHRPMPPQAESFFFRLPDGGSFFQFLLVLSLSFLLRINNQLLALNHEKLQAEVSYLKAQINPHFLFNTLNSIYALTLDKSDAAPDAVIRLSNMMRYVVTESSNELVPLEKEINYITDYVDMQRLRITDQSNLEYIVDGNVKGKSIAPLVVIPFIENAFKYGVNAEEDWSVKIGIRITEEDFTLNVFNKKVKISFPEDYITEQGIENTSKRLEFIYPGRHELQLTDAEDSFSVRLKISWL
ncbi:histidine kinase [Flavobacterium sp. CYK-4]|uniref:sensor histidine kinase n=1 Tax=Flavobacterium lotistagni TaxID=2709660 RepID=UPI00140E0C51|nr:sensor histidine kinase [Flavobacterium lotistagni]NHM06683.1 histidine kinase [Flavobacterium lotistagni]